MGGYQLISIFKIFTNGEGQEIAGIYDKFERSNKKRIIITDLKVGSEIFNDFEINPVKDENGTYSALVYLGEKLATISVTTENIFTITMTDNEEV